jgi:hypothetical protein
VRKKTTTSGALDLVVFFLLSLISLAATKVEFGAST